MFRFSDEFLYTKDHLWVQQEDDDLAQIGVTQVLLTISGEPEEVEFMAVEGEQVRPGQTLARLLTEDDEWEVPAPFEGTIISFNIEVADQPESVADDPFDEGWLIRMRPQELSALDHLLEASDYEDHVVDQLAEIEEDLLEEDDDYGDDDLDEDDRFPEADEEDEDLDDDY